MVKFCETGFAQSELMVYMSFEKNYKTYRTTWSSDADAFQPELDAATIGATRAFAAAAGAKTETAASAAAAAAAKATTRAASIDVAAATTI